MSEFEQLVDAYYQALFRFAMSLGHDSEMAADLVQETFCIWAAKGAQLKDRGKAKTWLFTTLHREFLNQRRRASWFADAPIDDAAAAAVGPQEDAERQIDGQRVLELLGVLEESFRGPLALFYLQQHSYKEIAEILDIPVGTVMSRLSRGKELLRKQMTAEASSAPKNILRMQDEGHTQDHG